MYRTLKLEIKRAVATVTLNRPEARNAMSAQLMREMIACAGRVGALRDVDAVIVRGSARTLAATLRASPRALPEGTTQSTSPIACASSAATR